MLRLQNDFAKWGVVATATNKTSTLKNICKGASKVRCSFSHRVFSLVLCYMNKDRGGLSVTKTILKKQLRNKLN